MFKSSIAIAGIDVDVSDLAAQLSLPVVSPDSTQYDFILLKTSTQLSLIRQLKPKATLTIDFSSSQLQYRRAKGGSELLTKAVGLNKNKNLNIIDATAGLGRDAFIMACHGGKITMLEKNPLVAILLEDALNKLMDERLKLKLIKSDSIEYLKGLIALPDVIYLDPMFPERQKSALVKKEMQFLQQILIEDQQPELLLAIALKKATKKVVVKRPNSAEFLGAIEPSYSLKSKANRFDIYVLENCNV